MKNVGFVISGFGTGRGGHFYDFKVFYEGLKNKVRITPIQIGMNASPVLSDVAPEFIKYNALNFVAAVYSLYNIIKENNIDIIQCFDLDTYPICRFVSFLSGIPVILIKCGGANPKKYYPRADAHVVFSKENYDYFSRRSFDEVYCLPNRALPFPIDQTRIDKLGIEKGMINLVRISRFDIYYKEAFYQSINLLKHLVSKGIKARLYFIGTPSNISLLNQLKKDTQCFDVVYITDDYFTVDASSLLDGFDYAIVTGRGAMESTSFGLSILAPVKGSNLPIYVSESNIEHMLATNFSLRTEVDEKSVFDSIVRLESDILESSRCKNEMKIIFNKKFNFDTVVPEYLSIYQKIKKKKHPIGDVLIHCAIAVRSIIKRIVRGYK